MLLRLGLFGGSLFIAVLLLLSVLRMTRIGAGYVGVEVNLAGSQHGVGVLFTVEDADHRVSNFCADGEVDGGHE